MKYLIVVIAALVLINSCSDEDSISKPDSCIPFFSAESLQVEVRHIFIKVINIWVWEATATYKYKLEGCSGKIHTHEFNFNELDSTFIEQDKSIADCIEPADVQLEKTVSVSTFDDIFAGYDTVTVYFTLSGLFQQCSSGSADSIEVIFWSDTIRALVID